MLFGRHDLDTLKQKLSVGEYLRSLEESLDSFAGHNATTIAKLALIGFAVLLVIVNLHLALAGFVGFLAGAWLAKRSYRIAVVSNALNKVATYINRLR